MCLEYISTTLGLLTYHLKNGSVFKYAIVYISVNIPNANEIVIRPGIFKNAVIVTEMDYKDEYT